MIEFPLGILMVVGSAIAICVIAMLHVFSCVMKHEVTLHNLRNRVERLQNDYAVHLARMSGELGPEFETTIIEEPEPDATIEPTEPVEIAEVAVEAPADQPELAAPAAA